jgi:hypothetical protein
MLLTEPGAVPELRTPRQNGALLPGWVLARWALVSFDCGSGSAAALAPGAAAEGTGSSFAVPWATAAPPRADQGERQRHAPEDAAHAFAPLPHFVAGVA